MTTATAVAVPCQHDGCEAETMATVAGDHVTGYRPGCQHHQAWSYVETTAREQTAETGPVKGAEGRPAGAREGEPPAEAVLADAMATVGHTLGPIARGKVAEYHTVTGEGHEDARAMRDAWDTIARACREAP